ncbi:DUF1549 domain-containing protein [Acanthopleuribacter pedis]|uniref:DUF1549 domain-containing protein n=1 Tax=Acanthopleuribacter pedis TaxID=442870 RepID=A0A8J7QLR7_9BACT|nr:DUF1549 domain-containing protein [Acanthopleuribacter pedis]MBO1320648.1 DUF1549 domain-containing protein [Acanthopleuribacter pedis]
MVRFYLIKSTVLLLLALLIGSGRLVPAYAGDPHPNCMSGCDRADRGKTTRGTVPKATFLFPSRYQGMALPVADQPANLIDRVLFEVQREAGVERTFRCDDLNFMRRVSLDLTGRIPNLKRILAFLKDQDPDKRARYVDELLASEAFVDRWTYWFNELFETTYKVQNTRGAVGFSTFYLREAVAENRSLATMATELITARGNSYRAWSTNYLLRAGGLGGNLQDRVDNEATHITDVFLGTSTACISCHDGSGYLDDINLFLSRQKRRNFWETAAFLTAKQITSDNPLLHGFDLTDRLDTPYIADTVDGMRPPREGGVIPPRFVLTGEEPGDGEHPAAALARMVTEDRMFARNFVNRLWGHMTAVPFVSPYNELDPARLDPDQPPPSPWTLQANQPRLMEAMTDFFIESGHDLRATLRLIALSETYQLSTDTVRDWRPEHRDLYVRRVVRELTGEEVFDQFVVATDVLRRVGAAGIERVPGDGDSFTPLSFVFAHQFPDNYHGHMFYMLTQFLTVFGVGNRYDQPRFDAPAPSQALLMMNDYVIQGRIGPYQTYIVWERDEHGNITNEYREVISQLTHLAHTALSDREKIRRTFLAILMREPTRLEMRKIEALKGNQSFVDVAHTLHWTLINYSEFRINY